MQPEFDSVRDSRSDLGLKRWLDALRSSCPDDTLSYDQYDFDISDDGSQADKQTLALALKEAIGQLDSRSKAIIYRRYFMGETQDELAAKLKVTQARISQLESKALATLKASLGGSTNPAPTARSHEVWLRSVESDINSRPHYAQTRYR
jgi:RNA polymerase sigma factor (sigma-70 family)